MVSCVLFPFLSGLPAIFQVFVAFLTSFPQVGHFAMINPYGACYHSDVHKTLSIHPLSMVTEKAKLGFFLVDEHMKMPFFRNICALKILNAGEDMLIFIFLWNYYYRGRL